MAPTQSWASRSEGIDCTYQTGTEDKRYVTVKNAEVRTTDDNEMSRVTFGCLRLYGILIPGPVMLGDDRCDGGSKALDKMHRD